MANEQKRTQVLLIEDNPGDARLFQEAIRSDPHLQYSLQVATTLAAAFALLSTDSFDVAFLDLHLPDASGIDLLMQIRARYPMLAVIVLTGTHNETLGIHAVQSGAQDYLIKGQANDKQILQSLHFAVERQRQTVDLLRFNQYAIENAGESIVWVNDQAQLIYVNKKACEILGYARSEMLHLSILDISPALSGNTWETFWKHATEGQSITFESQHRRKDGSLIHVEISINRVLFDGKRYHCAFIRDISERKQTEEALRYSEEQLRLSQRLEAIGRLAGGVAHDFNNLLTAIKGYSELIEENLSEDDPKRADLDEIKKAAERAATLTRQLLAFSRKQVLQPQVLNFNFVIQDMEKMLRRLSGEDIEFIFQLNESAGQIKADKGQVEQILLNLVVNSRDAMPKNGKITIETANVFLDEAYINNHIAVKTGAYVMMAVTDTGHGMSRDTLTHIFEPFFTTKPMEKGTGLGLATVYGIVKQSGGSIWVYSEIGKGTTFKVYFPEVQEKVEQGVAAVQIAYKHGSETILLVEDDQAIRRLVSKILKKNGYTVLEAANGLEALKVIDTYKLPIHLLLSDVIMPEMSGADLVEHLTVKLPDTKILYMSGYPDSAIAHHGILRPGTNFMQKPFTPEMLTARVREVLSAPHHS